MNMPAQCPLERGEIISLADSILGGLGMDDRVVEFANKLYEEIVQEIKRGNK